MPSGLNMLFLGSMAFTLFTTYCLAQVKRCD